MLESLRNKIVYNKNLDMMKIFLKKIVAVLRVLSRTFTEIKDIIFIIKRSGSDRDFLACSIRRNAHILEKMIKNLDAGSEHSKQYGDMVANDLDGSIRKWDRYGYGKCETVKWAKKIYDEYQNFRVSKFTCSQIGKTSSHEDHQDLLSIMKSRRSIRQWKNEPVTMEKINLLIEAARWAPSSCNRQTCKFVLIIEKKLIKKISRTTRGGKFFSNAPLLILVLNDVRHYVLPDEGHILFQDAAAAIQNLLLMAHSLGLGACWGAYTSDTGIIINEHDVRKLLKIPSYCKISGIVALGQPAENACTIPRKDFDDLVFLNNYGHSHSISK